MAEDCQRDWLGPFGSLDVKARSSLIEATAARPCGLHRSLHLDTMTILLFVHQGVREGERDHHVASSPFNNIPKLPRSTSRHSL